MRCIDLRRGASTVRRAAPAAAIALAFVAGCAAPPRGEPAVGAVSPAVSNDSPRAAPSPVDAPAATVGPRYVRLGAAPAPADAAALKRQMAQRLVDAHPDTTYRERAPDRLAAIPVLEVELHRDGRVRRIDVLRRPSTGDEATQLAIDAVHRAAPYGDLSRLRPPYKVIEVFLFDDAMRFKPRTLDID